MDYLENKYLSLLSNRLRNYKRKSGNTINFSCPVCGDSDTDKKKARGYIYSKLGKTLYHCHNCTVTMGFDKFLKTVDYQLHSAYIMEKLKDSKTPEQLDLEMFTAKMKKPVFLKSGPLKTLKKISQLPSDHPAKIFISERMIPNPFHAKIFWCPKFYSWSNEVIPDKFSEESLQYDQGRVLIPFINKDKVMHAFQGRALSGDVKTRYITIVNDETTPKVYGLDEVDFRKKNYVLEGPIDSMFLPNSIATAGGDLVSTVRDLPKDNMVVVYDNESRSRETVAKISKAIINGYKVCIFPTNFTFKDINDAILGGLSSEFIRYIIDQHTYSDLGAMAKLNQWKKV